MSFTSKVVRTIFSKSALVRGQVCTICSITGKSSLLSGLKVMEDKVMAPRRSQRLMAKKVATPAANLNRFYAISTDGGSLRVIHDPEAGHFYVKLPGIGQAYLEYKQNGDVMTVETTEVPSSLQGRGVGKVLAQVALAYAAANKLGLVINCDFVRHYIQNYAPQYMDLMDIQDYTSLVLYYGRAHFYHSMQKTALDGLAKFPMHSAFRLFNGIALVLGNRVQEGIRELNPLKNEKELGLAAILALIYAHKRCGVVDRDAMTTLEQRLKEERKSLNSPSVAYYAAVFLFLTGRVEKAREYADKSLKLDGQNEAAAVLKAWTDLTQKTSVSGNVLHVFDLVLSRGKNIDATLGQVRFFQMRGQFDNAINALNKLSVRFPELNIPLIEKMDTLLAALDWDHAFETALRIINLEPINVAALRVKAMLLITRESNFKAGASTIQQLLAAVERVEVGNYDLALQICVLFSRICSRNRDVLSLTLNHVDKMTQLNPANVEFITELGYQRYLLGNIKDAVVCFRSATKLEDNYFFALCGLTLCLLAENEATEQTRQQIDFLGELRGIEPEPLLLFLKSKIAENSDRAVALLIQATEAHLQRVEAVAFGAEYLRLFNPDFLLQITTELLRYSPIEIRVKQGVNLTYESLHITLKHSISILEAVVRSCPGHTQAIFMRAKVELLCGEFSTATMTLQRILTEIDQTYTDAHLLLAQIQLQQQQLNKAMRSLEMALSHNFAVRENPMYHLLLGIVQKQQQHLPEAQKSFLDAMQLVGSPYLGSEQACDKLQSAHSNGESTLNAFTVSDKVTLYLELIKTLREMGDAQAVYESERLLQCAMEEFSHTSEEGRLVIAHAELLLQNCEVTKAINLLNAIQPGQSYYIQAKTHLANIYLQNRKDRVAFAKCFKELVEARPETESYLMLGEAYMSIQEPDLAVDAYQKALNMNPYDSLLASKLGRAYVKTHQYARAITYYQEALKNPDHSGLKLDLAELYLKLKQYQNAADTLLQDVEQRQIDDQDTTALQLRTKQLLLLARIYEKSGNISKSLQTLQEARDNQYRVQINREISTSNTKSSLSE